MAKKKNVISKPAAQDKPATLKDLLDPIILQKLKAQADGMKAAEENRKEEERKQKEEARKLEQKRLDNDFGHLLENSGMDWKKYK
ncbi:MAG: YqkE family protein [Gorillibacterium sp.]|nr:YqkE family protein [Gorillibacterium sp.]